MRTAIRRLNRTLVPVQNTLFPLTVEPAGELVTDADPHKAITNGKIMAKAWASTLVDDTHRLKHAHSFIYTVVQYYWNEKEYGEDALNIHSFPEGLKLTKLDESIVSIARAIGKAIAALHVLEACYFIGSVYTAVLPDKFRSENGIFYTPPSLTRRLLDMAEEAGADWKTHKVLDPACGGGAFLAPVALRILQAHKDTSPEAVIAHLEKHLKGIDIDLIGGWITQVSIEVALLDTMKAAGRRIAPLVEIADTLRLKIQDQYDVIIGNPPYGKVNLTPNLKEKFSAGLYGHANLYALFTDLAFKLASDNGIIALLTPTSFLSGQYFKNLRRLIGLLGTPLEIDFVLNRKNVFEDVLQEIVLTTYIKGSPSDRPLSVKNIDPDSVSTFQLETLGSFDLPAERSLPWILPRTMQQAGIVGVMSRMKSRLRHWGFSVSTGPLVWNRHKDQFATSKDENTLPVIWAESVTQDGQFIWKCEKKNHIPYLRLAAGDDWLKIKAPCVLLQRTTAKEQQKRLIAASIPNDFLKKTGGAVVENHLNMLYPRGEAARIPLVVLSAFLNSKAANDAFRCISGSVAVSAYELEALPVPDASELTTLTKLVENHASSDEIEAECLNLYS